MVTRMLGAMWGTIVARRLIVACVALAATTAAAGCTATPVPSETPVPSASSGDSDDWVPFDSLFYDGFHGFAPEDWVVVDNEDWWFQAGLVDAIGFTWPSEHGNDDGNGLRVYQLDVDWNEYNSWFASPIADHPGAEPIVLDTGYPAYWIPWEEAEAAPDDGMQIVIYINVDGKASYVYAWTRSLQANPGFEDDVRRFVSLLTFTPPQQ